MVSALSRVATMTDRRSSDDIFSTFKGLFGDFFKPGAELPDTFTSTEVRVDMPSAKPVAPGGHRPYRTTLDGESLVLDVDLPGIAPRDVTLHVTNTQVIVKAQRGNTGFTHRYTLSADYDLSTATATMADGQLRVRVTRVASAPPRRVPIDYATR